MQQEGGVTVKGTREGLTLLVAPELPLGEILAHLRERFESDSGFFQNAELVLDLGPRPFQESEFRLLRDALDSAGVRLKGILSDNPITKLLAREGGIELLGSPSIMHSRVRADHPVKQERLAGREKEPPADRNKRAGNALFAHRTLRSGQKLHHGGDVTILGDVNPGAEVVATGNIAVFGALRGLAHAGAEGKRDAVVVALELVPTQLRIADCVARAPEHHPGTRVPELARIQDDAIIIEVYGKNERT